jgi:hypothetical protein
MRRAMSDSKAHLDELARHDPHDARGLQPLGDARSCERIQNPRGRAAKRAAAS